MLRKLRNEMERRDEGFTLIELLVVVIIIGILAAIAIPVFLNQREKAWERAVTSDLRNGAVQMESYFTENNAYPSDVNTVNGFQSSQGVTVTTTVGTSGGFCLQGAHDNVSGETWAYDTRTGGGAPVKGATC